MCLNINIQRRLNNLLFWHCFIFVNFIIFVQSGIGIIVPTGTKHKIFYGMCKNFYGSKENIFAERMILFGSQVIGYCAEMDK